MKNKAQSVAGVMLWVFLTLAPAAVSAQEIDALESTQPTHPQHSSLVRAVESYRLLAAHGGWPSLPQLYDQSYRLGDPYPHLDLLVKRLERTGELPSPFALPVSRQITLPIVQALRIFQRNHGLEEDGVLGPDTIRALNVSVESRIRQLLINIDRWRSLPPALGQRYVLVNVPAFRLFAFENNVVSESLPIIVGKDYGGHQTPIFADEIERVNFRPYWNVPRSIVVNELLADSFDISTLYAQGFEVVSHFGSSDPLPLTYSNLEAVRAGRLSIRQRPGPNNALGQIKFIFPNSYSVYLHDTPQSHLFQHDKRTFSHGCVRVKNPELLAQFLLRSHHESWNVVRVLGAMNGRDNVMIALPKPVPVYLVYLTAWIGSDGRVSFYRDIYDRDKGSSGAIALRN